MKKFILILAFCISCAQTDDTINTPKTINYDVVNIHQTDYVPWSIEFINNDTFIYTERRGKMFLVSNGVTTEILNVQKRLSELGFYSGEIDGINGSRTKIAIKNFQSRAGLTPDGIIGPKTLSALEKGEESYVTINNSNNNSIFTDSNPIFFGICFTYNCSSFYS